MTEEEARKEAERIGGYVGWGVDEGFYVIPPVGYAQPTTPTTQDAGTVPGSIRWPWQTPAGEGFIAPWTPQESYVDPATGETQYRPTTTTGVTEPTGPQYTFDEPGQIPPEMMGMYDWEWFTEYYTQDGQNRQVQRVRLIPKAEMTPYQQWQTGQTGTSATGMTEEEQRYLELREQESQQAYEQMLWERKQVGQPSPAPQWRPGELELQQQRFGLDQQQLAQQQQNTLAQMMAQPSSWLEYAAASGQPPVIQPWMMPLMPQEYQGLEGLRVGQQIPGWPTQGTQTPYQPPTGGTTTGGTPTGGAYTGGLSTGAGLTPTGQPFDLASLTASYIARGLSPEEAAKEAQHEISYENWLAMPTGAEGKRQAFLETGQIAAERPETQQRYQQAISNLQSGQPLMGSLSVDAKYDLVEQLLRQGMDRTLAERQVFGGNQLFSKYTPVSEIGGQAYTPTPTPSYTPPSEYQQPTASTGSITQTPGYVPPYEYPDIKPGEFTRIPAYIPGQSWHTVELSKRSGDDNPTGEIVDTGTNWRERFQQITPQSSRQATPEIAGTASNLPLGGMPWLTRPSRQYQARLGPSALQQYYAYVQARTGATPEETQWRLQSMAPPGGQYSGLSYVR